uniref:CCHC-type domain-containing protein n=1 Tax=Acrobeloides nanus TaxID=290746 RepID=A0A914CU76_9BILA
STRNDKGKDKPPSREVVSAVTAEPSQKPAQSVNGQKVQRHKFEHSNQRSNNGKRHYCLICEAYGHGTTRCPKNPTAKSKATALMAKKRCMKCAKMGHKSPQCPKLMICSHCKQSHPSFTCRTLDQVNGQSTVAVVTNVECSDDNDAAVVAAITSVVAATNQAPAQEQMEVLLLSSEVTIANPHTHQESPALAFLDPGSQSSFIADSIAEKLQLIPIRTRTIIFDNPIAHAQTKSVKEYEIELLLKDGT